MLPLHPASKRPAGLDVALVRSGPAIVAEAKERALVSRSELARAHTTGGPLVPCRCQPRAGHAAYSSPWCLIGTHDDCSHFAPPAPPPDVPVIFESCSCACHRAATGEVPR